ncbi:Zinc finger PHD-type [Arabidopsis thaliana x Arabidopsis arenosa]|uniref:Origin recognition complex subunit 1 n=1 Tax=Arabidopsis thaliana x Arabidopsis arenosa TaxID=1240361 RepID=A0A8T1Y708_9BRAS|nr:Zinc finger PHD-type [Arabidopsis thaliana x Arabidopsis arenosa]
MAATPSSKAKTFQSPNKTPTNMYRKSYLSPSSTSLTPQTPETLTPLRRSSRHVSRKIDLGNDPIDLQGRESIQEINLTPRKRTTDVVAETLTTPKKKKIDVEASFSPISPNRSETITKKKKKKRVYYNRVEFDETEFEIGDHVYVKRREDANSDEEEDPEIEDCQICFKSDTNIIMIECDDCLGGFHLNCLKPPLKVVPKGDWICQFCVVHKPPPLQGKKKSAKRTMREKLLSGDLWAARIEKLWKQEVVDGGDVYWIRARWYMIPEETVSGRQRHNLKRELYLTNDFADIEMECVLRHCFVKCPVEFSKASNDGDDVFLCEYEYDVHWHSFKRLVELADGDSDSDQEWNGGKEKEIDSDDDEESVCADSKSKRGLKGANSRKGRIFGLAKRIPEHVRCHKETELEKAKATLLLATRPQSLPCRSKEMEEITAFIKGSILDDQCLGRCMYIHGVPGTGKTISVLSVMKNLKAEVEAGSVSPYCFVEINGLKLASPENIYSVIYEAMSGHRVGWKKALQFLNERFAEGKRIGKEEGKPCILLIDELDLLVTRNQSVLYNILDWPTKPNSRLVVLGIANTMDLPEKLLPRISSRMGIHRLCFGPYNHTQLQEIVSTRLKGINAFEKTAIEFASRKVAAVSGDARRALEICRRAAEVADYRLKKTNKTAKSQLVIMADVEVAIQEMFQAPHIQVMKSVSKLSKIFLTAMVHELYKTGMAETSFDRVATTVSSLCLTNGEAFPGWGILLKIGCDLGECRIVLCEPGEKHRLQKLQLNFPSDDVAFALKDNKDLPWLANYL